MIICTDGRLIIEGSGGTILLESAVILNDVYTTVKEKYGDQFASELLALIGRLAVADGPDMEKQIDEAFEGLFGRSDA